MSKQLIKLTVYGADIKCASCVNAPGSKETFDWLKAAISRKYYDEAVEYRYVDIQEPAAAEDQEIVQQILDDEYFYPLVLVEDDVAGEGNPRLKSVYRVLEQHGLQPRDEDR